MIVDRVKTIEIEIKKGIKEGKKQRTDAKIKEGRLREITLKEAIDKSLLKLPQYWKN